MADHLYLHITGLCALVPKKPIAQGTNQMRVLLVEERHHGPHLPVLLCPFDRVDTGAGLRQPDRVFYEPENAIKTALFSLAGQDLKVDGAAADQLNFTNGNGSGSECHRNNRDDIEWVAAVATIDPGSGTVKSACFDPARVDPAVAARVQLTQGTVSTLTLAASSTDRVIRWQFRVPPGGAAIAHRQAISEIVQYDYSFTATGSTVDLLVGPFGTATPDMERIRLKLQGNPGEVTAFVKNVPALEIFSLVHKPKPDTREDDVHFKHFYDLSTNATPTLRVPCMPDDPMDPLPRCPGSPGPSVKNPHCPPALFDPNAQA